MSDDYLRKGRNTQHTSKDTNRIKIKRVFFRRIKCVYL